MDLTHYSLDQGDWPNRSRMIVTDDDGKFRVTVPPKDTRFWFRFGTTPLGFSTQTGVGKNEVATDANFVLQISDAESYFHNRQGETRPTRSPLRTLFEL